MTEVGAGPATVKRSTDILIGGSYVDSVPCSEGRNRGRSLKGTVDLIVRLRRDLGCTERT